MIKFAKERVNLICNQLKGWSIVQKVHLDSMRVKEGCFITPTEADAAPGEWKNFDMGKDHERISAHPESLFSAAVRKACNRSRSGESHKPFCRCAPGRQCEDTA